MSLSLVTIWKQLYDHYKGDPGKLTMFTIPVLCLSELPIYFFTLLDVLQLDALYKYRLHYAREVSGHLDTRHYPPLDVIKRVAKMAEFNFLFAYAIPGAIAIKISSMMGIYVYDTDRELTWKRLIKEVLCISVLADLCFYALHRLMHTPQFYQSFHKKHHEFKYSFALVHHYMCYKEALVFALPQALPPIMLIPFFGKQHVMSMWVSFFGTQLSAILGHAGWQVPFLPSWLPVFKPGYHDFHHVDYSVNFGAIYEFTDALFGTLVKAPISTLPEIAERALEKGYDYVKNAPTLDEFNL